MSEIAGLQLWLDGTSGIETEGGGVARWRDLSGKGYDFEQSQGELRPTIGDGAVSFDGRGQHLARDGTLGLSNDQNRTVFVVGRLEDKESRSPLFVQGKLGAKDASSNFYGIEANTWNTGGERFGVYLVSQAYDSKLATDLAYHVHAIRTSGFPAFEDMENGTTYFVDGEEQAISQTAGGVENQTFAGDRSAIGAFTGEERPSVTLDGSVAAVAVYGGALSDADVRAVSAALAERYGL